MSIALYRIDDRLMHGQVVVGWGRPLRVSLIVLVDDVVASSSWEQDLYRMGTPPEMELVFETCAGAIERLPWYQADPRSAILLTADVETMRKIVEATGSVRQVNIGGLHHRTGRSPRLHYVFLSPEEERSLRDIEARGVSVTAQDLPSASPVRLAEVLAGSGM